MARSPDTSRRTFGGGFAGRRTLLLICLLGGCCFWLVSCLPLIANAFCKVLRCVLLWFGLVCSTQQTRLIIAYCSFNLCQAHDQFIINSMVVGFLILCLSASASAGKFCCQRTLKGKTKTSDAHCMDGVEYTDSFLNIATAFGSPLNNRHCLRYWRVQSVTRGVG